MSKPDSILQEIVSGLNGSLSNMDADFEVGLEASIRYIVTVGPLEHETYLRMSVTEDSIKVIDKKQQVERITEEIMERFEPDRKAATLYPGRDE